jgi:glucokinase
MPSDAPVLAGDVGGTKTVLRLVSAGSSSRQTLHTRRFESARYPGLDAIVREFLAEAGSELEVAPRVAAFGVAGPVVDGACVTTNLPWELSERSIAEACGLDTVRLMNDFEATAYGVLDLPASAVVPLHHGEPRARGAIAVIGAGTGLGEALVVDRRTSAVSGDWLVVPGEGGHADFGPFDALSAGLWRYLHDRHGHVSWERVVSGLGIASIYEFLRESGSNAESPTVAAELAEHDPNAVIGRHAVAGTDPLCVATIDLFAACYGAEAGNLALKGLATGGVFLTGGIAPKILPRLRAGGFVAQFRAKGRLSYVVDAIPVHVVLDQDVPLHGAVRVALEL